VFSDRQPVEWGLTEIIEQSMGSRVALPHKGKGIVYDDLEPVEGAEPVEVPVAVEEGLSGDPWLIATIGTKSDWRLIVQKGYGDDGKAEEARLGEDSDAIFWVDHGYTSTIAAPSVDVVNAMFNCVDNSMASGADPEQHIYNLIIGLKAYLRHAIQSKDVMTIEAAILMTREIEMPEKQRAIEIVCQQRLKAAHETGIEAEMRRAVRAARSSGATHVPAYHQVYAEQQRLYNKELLEKLEAQFRIAEAEADFASMVAMSRVAQKHDLRDIVSQAYAASQSMVEFTYGSGSMEELEDMESLAQDGGWTEMKNLISGRIDDLSMVKAIEAAAEKDNLNALRAVEKRAKAKGRTHIEVAAVEAIGAVAKRVGDRTGLPAEWDLVLEMSGQRDGRAKLLKKKVVQEEALLQRMQELVDATYTGWGGLGKNTRTRDRATEIIAERLIVKSVVKVENAENYINFRSRRDAVADECQRMGSLRTDWNIKTKLVDLVGVGKHSENPVHYKYNEYYLWHGTTPKGAEGITDKDFDMKRAGSAYGALFGGGLYFAESTMKSDEYTKQDSRGWFPMILCRVVLGNVYYCDAMDPTKLRAELEGACRPGGPGFHSVLGDREKVRRTFREFVVYDNHQVYPEYIVWYARVGRHS